MNPLLERIRRLRNLSRNNSNPNEAAAAAAAAEKLIAEHGIQEAMLETDPDDRTPLGDHAPLDMMSSRGTFVYWRSYLLSILCDMHSCAYYYGVGKGRRQAIFFGRPDDVEVVRELYGWLSGEIDRLTSAAGRGKGKAWATSYRLGCVKGIWDAMVAAKEEAERRAPSTALAVLDKRLTDAQKERDKASAAAPKVKAQDADDEEHEEAFAQGERDGYAAQRRGPKKESKRPRLARGRDSKSEEA